MPAHFDNPARGHGLGRYGRIGLVCMAALLLSACASTGSPKPGENSFWRDMVPAAELEKESALQYSQLRTQAAQSRALVAANDPQLLRLRRIADRLIPYAARWNPRAAQWQWEVNLLRSDQINAFCMPAGKIAFYTGILEKLKLDDNEVAAVMGHEIAHALREHARAQAGKGSVTQLGTSILGQVVGGGQYAGLIDTGGKLLSLKYSRDDETDADLVGLDLVARAGFDPRAAITLWKKMNASGSSAPPQWLSTHPSGESRIQGIEAYLPQVMPLYEATRQNKRS